MLDYIKKEQVEIAPSEEGTADEFYRPHHAVKKENGVKPNGGLFLMDPLMKNTHRL
jgi:hypothetical protein